MLTALLLTGVAAARRSVGTACSARCLKNCPLLLLLPGGWRRRIYTALATFTASGMDTDTAMERASDDGRHPLRAQLESCRRQMLEGRSLAQAVYDNRVFEPLYARMLMSGARSGNLDQVLARLAQVFSEDANMRMGRIIDKAWNLCLQGFHRFGGITLFWP